MNPTADTLRDREIPGIARFEDVPGGLVRLVLTPPAASAHVFLQGGHVTHFQPAGAAPVLFLSKQSAFAPGKPIRGGVPVIFPWFGARSGHPESPAHGFARTLPWELESLTASEGGGATVSLVLRANVETRAHWPHEFLLRHRIVVGTELELTLEVENPGAGPFTFEEALHTYLAVTDARQVEISGLSGCEFIDKVDGFRSKVQDTAPIRFTGETDRVYLRTKAACTLRDQERSIEISKQGSDTTVIWNPWIAKAKAMSDFGDDEWMEMACIETANAADNAVTLAPGERKVMRARIAR
jgi:glucose-6-phosphate 1-epimerase